MPQDAITKASLKGYLNLNWHWSQNPHLCVPIFGTLQTFTVPYIVGTGIVIEQCHPLESGHQGAFPLGRAGCQEHD